MTFIPPPKPPEPKERGVLITEQREIDAMMDPDFWAPRGYQDPVTGLYYAEIESLKQFRDPAYFLEQTPPAQRIVHEREDL